MARVTRRTADLQLFSEVTAHHLQEPVRRLASYAASPLMKAAGIGKEAGTALLVPPVILAVWAMIRRIRSVSASRAGLIAA